MDDCPHCGEPVPFPAESCPHCGSDAETGWNPDIDYLSLELPENDSGGTAGLGQAGLDREPARRLGPGAGAGGSGSPWRPALGYALVTLAGTALFVAARASARPEGLVLFVILALSFFFADARARAAIRRQRAF